jgi:WhiB family redox-sensing transcriptional regulator
MPNRDWVELANCRGVDTNLFFPERGQNEIEGAGAKQVCSGCVVREECLSYALRNGEKHGIWGGTTERERKKIRRRERVPA